MRPESIIDLARKHLGGKMESSARLCLLDAETLLDKDFPDQARDRALQSLKYSVGITHAVYQIASFVSTGDQHV